MDDLHQFYKDFFVNGTKDLLSLTCKDFLAAAWDYLDVTDIKSLIEANFKESLTAPEKELLCLRFRHAVQYFQFIIDKEKFAVIDRNKNLEGFSDIVRPGYIDEIKNMLPESYPIVKFLKLCAVDQERDCRKLQKKLEREVYPDTAKQSKRSGTRSDFVPEEDKLESNKKIELEKREVYFTKVLNQKNTSGKINISSCIRKYMGSDKSEKRFNALRGWYERWSKEYPIVTLKKSWPTVEFIKFCSLISIYIQDPPEDEQTFLGIPKPQRAICIEQNAPQVRLFWRDTKNFSQKNNQISQQKEFDEEEKNINAMKKLASRNNVQAKDWLLKGEHIDNKTIQNRYEVQLAMYDYGIDHTEEKTYKNYRQARGWSATLMVPQFIAGKRNRFGLVYPEADDGIPQGQKNAGHVQTILPSTLVKRLEFVIVPDKRLSKELKSEYPIEKDGHVSISNPNIYDLDKIS